MASLVCGMPCGMPCVTKPAFRLLVSPRRGNTLFAQHNTNPLHRVGVTGRLSHCNAHVAGSSHSMMHTQPMKTSKFLGQDLAAAHVGRCSNGATRHRVIRYTAKAQLAATNVGRPLPKAAPLNSRVSKFHGLDGDDFRHPLDQQNTRLLKVLPGLEGMAKNILGPVAEQVLLLENIGTSVLVGPEQLPSLHRLLLTAASTLQMDPPDLYIKQNPVPNAYTLAIGGRKPFVVVHTALLELLEPLEVQAVIAHELGHLKCSHGVWLTMANVLASNTLSVLPLLSGAVEEGLLRWLRAAELTCDRAALLVAQDHRVVISTLMKLAGGSPKLNAELNVEAFLRQARSYDEASSTPFGWYIKNAQTRALSHPLPVMRAREIDNWAASSQYRALLAKNYPHRRRVLQT